MEITGGDGLILKAANSLKKVKPFNVQVRRLVGKKLDEKIIDLLAKIEDFGRVRLPRVNEDSDCPLKSLLEYYGVPPVVSRSHEKHLFFVA